MPLIWKLSALERGAPRGYSSALSDSSHLPFSKDTIRTSSSLSDRQLKHQSIIMAFSTLSVRSPFVAGTRALATRRISAVRAPVVQRRSFVVRAVSIPHRFKFSLWHHLALTAGTGRCIGRRPQHPLP